MSALQQNAGKKWKSDRLLVIARDSADSPREGLGATVRSLDCDRIGCMNAGTLTYLLSELQCLARRR
jgi:hypothetical protein